MQTSPGPWFSFVLYTVVGYFDAVPAVDWRCVTQHFAADVPSFVRITLQSRWHKVHFNSNVFCIVMYRYLYFRNHGAEIRTVSVFTTVVIMPFRETDPSRDGLNIIFTRYSTASFIQLSLFHDKWWSNYSSDHWFIIFLWTYSQPFFLKVIWMFPTFYLGYRNCYCHTKRLTSCYRCLSNETKLIS
jgi:hypothetical protein